MNTQYELFTVGERGPAQPHPGRYASTKRAKPTPAPIGSGPEGETCKTCLHYCRVKYHDKVYLKCGLLRTRWTHGPGTDIKAGWQSCREWEPNENHSSLIPPGFTRDEMTTVEGRAIAADYWLEAGDDRKAEILRKGA